jgi:phage gpG-like protein
VRPEPARADGLGRASSSVAPHTVYARIQQMGGEIVPVRAKVLRWKEGGRYRYARRVVLPARPYMVMTPARARTCRERGIRAVERTVREALAGG